MKKVYYISGMSGTSKSKGQPYTCVNVAEIDVETGKTEIIKLFSKSIIDLTSLSFGAEVKCNMKYSDSLNGFPSLESISVVTRSPIKVNV